MTFCVFRLMHETSFPRKNCTFICTYAKNVVPLQPQRFSFAFPLALTAQKSKDILEIKRLLYLRILSIYHNLNFVFREYCECSRLYVSFLHIGYERVW